MFLRIFGRVFVVLLGITTQITVAVYSPATLRVVQRTAGSINDKVIDNLPDKYAVWASMASLDSLSVHLGFIIFAIIGLEIVKKIFWDLFLRR